MVDRFEKFSLAIFEISRYWHSLTAIEMEKYGLKGSHSIYLATMSRFPNGITAVQLGELCCKDKADVSRTMSLFEKRGLVEKQGTNQKLYGGVYILTKEGKAAAQYVNERVSLAVSLAGEGLSDQSRAVFYESLNIITANLRALSQKGLPETDTKE